MSKHFGLLVTLLLVAAALARADFECSSPSAAQDPPDYAPPMLSGVYFADAQPRSVQASPACPGGICPGMGNGFPLWKINVMSVNTGGTVFFKNRTVGQCVLISDSVHSVRGFSVLDSMTSFNKHVMAEASLSGSYSAAAYGATSTATVVTSHDSSMTSTFHSVQMDIQVSSHAVDFVQTQACFSRDNLDPAFLAAFEALPLIPPQSVRETAQWNAYVQFMSSHGSHILMQQLIGSRFQRWESSTSSSANIADTLQAKACAEVEGLSAGGGWSVRGCGAYSQDQKQTAERTSSSFFQIVQGGTEETRTALTQDLNKNNLDRFIAAASHGNQPIRYMFKPIWELLNLIYSVPCGKGDKKACDSLQRAVNLQAAYEGWLSITCVPTASQGMAVVGSNAQGIRTYGCYIAKTGCHSGSSDCHGRGAACFCYGATCFDKGDEVPLAPGQYYDTVRASRKGHHNEGVNQSCYLRNAICHCNTNWAGGLPGRYIWLQSASHFAAPALSAPPDGSFSAPYNCSDASGH